MPIATDPVVTGLVTAEPGGAEHGVRNPRGLRQACLVAKVCDDFRGQDVRVIDLTRVTPIFDYFVIATAASRRQSVAIAEESDKIMKAEGSRRLGIEGHEGTTWILHDFGDVILHVFDPDARRNYSLESLWADAERIDWRDVLGLPQPTVEEAADSGSVFDAASSFDATEELLQDGLAEDGFSDDDETGDDETGDDETGDAVTLPR